MVRKLFSLGVEARRRVGCGISSRTLVPLSNSFSFKIICMVPLKWPLGEFFPSAVAAFLYSALGRLGRMSGPGVCCSGG